MPTREQIDAILAETMATFRTDADDLLDEARERYAAGVSMRGLRRPDDAPDGAWWSVQRRRLRTGEPVVYLMLRWRDNNRLRARSLGRLS